MSHFDDDRYYGASDPEVLALAPYSTFASWRCSGVGPAYHKIGGRVIYSGRDLNAWLAAQRVQTAQQSAAA